MFDKFIQRLILKYMLRVTKTRFKQNVYVVRVFTQEYYDNAIEAFEEQTGRE